MNLRHFKYKKFIAFGAGRTLKIAQKKKKINLSYIIDNDISLTNKKVLGLKIYKSSRLIKENNFLVIIYSPRFYEIKLQLEKYGLKYKKHFIHFLDFSIYKNLINNLTDEICYKNLECFISPGDICLDVGANVGIYTYKISKLVKSLGKVLSFEPLSIAFNQIKLVKRKYHLKNSQLFNFALGNKKESSKILTPVNNNLIHVGLSHIEKIKFRPQNLKKSPFSKESHKKINFNYIEEKIKIELIDNIVFKLKLNKINYIKIDVEGYELEVVKGALKSLKKFRPVIQCEIFSSKKKQKSLFNLLKSIDYCLLYPKKNKIIQIYNWQIIEGYSDYYLIPKEKLEYFKTKCNSVKFLISGNNPINV